VNKTIGLNGSYIDARYNSYNGSITLAPYSSAVLIKTGAAVAAPPAPAPPPVAAVIPSSCSATGTILREYWNNVNGTQVTQIPLHKAPDGSHMLSALESPSNGGNMYGARISGYICPPLSGNYTFSIAGDDGVELWVSTDDNPANKVWRTGNNSWTTFRDFWRFSWQKSSPVYLQAGQRYYIEALHKQGWGGDHVSVSWELPDGTTEAPIPGHRLAPYQPTSVSAYSAAPTTILSEASVSGQRISDQINSTAKLTAYPNPFSNVTTIQFYPTESGLASLDAYDITGKMVQRIYSGQVESGQKKNFTFKGAGLANGVYIVRLKTKTQTLSQRITLVK
jgi:hypothetical protein